MTQEGGAAAAAGEEAPKQRWYVVQAYSGFEGQVMRSLRERIARSELQDMFGDVLVPTEGVVEMRDGRKRKSERKFFPGYVLIKMEMNEATWHLVNGAPKILGFIGDNRKNDRTTGTSGSVREIAAISDAEANSILQRIEEGVDSPKPKVLFEAGEVVRIKDGPFTDFNGVVEEVNVAKNRLQVSVLIFGRSTPVELEFGQVEKE